MSPARVLLAWYDAHRRELPWRATRDPYRVWVSEVMLQQTRVETVLPYYRAFLERFPTVEALAAADVDEVLARWSGLGYYRRARQLHAAARQVAAAGAFPHTVEGLRALPGVGAYTAAAVASIAFGVAEPVVDGNVERLLARRLALAGDPRSAAGRRAVQAAAGELLDRARPGDGNQALMELGATVCTPRRPKCPLCPLAAGCRAAAEGDPERYPPPRRRRPSERRRLVVAVVERGGRVLLFRRPDDAELLAGTWELPWFEPAAGGDPAAAAPAALAGAYGGRWRLGPRRGRLGHGITFRALEVEVHGAEVAWGEEVAEGSSLDRAYGAGGGDAADQGADGAGGGDAADAGDAGDAAAAEAGWFDAAARRRLPMSALVEKALAVAEPAAGRSRRGPRGATPGRRAPAAAGPMRRRGRRRG